MFNSLASRVSHENRIRKFQIFLKEFDPTPQDTILDVGPSQYRDDNNSNMLERLYPYPEQITALEDFRLEKFSQAYPKVHVVTYDGTTFPFDDLAFDLCWSNSLLGRVGGFKRQVNFVKEIVRTSRRALITAPNRYFPYEAYTGLPLLHYLPKPVFDSVLMALGRRFRWATEHEIHLLSKRQIIRVLEHAGVEDYEIRPNLYWGMPLDYCVLINRRSSRSRRPDHCQSGYQQHPVLRSVADTGRCREGLPADPAHQQKDLQ